MIVLLAPFALGMALSAPGACATPADCGYYKPANPNVVFVDERRERPYPVIGDNPATWSPQPPVIGSNPATWSQPGGYGGGGYAYEQAAYAQQAYGQAAYGQQSYSYATPSYPSQGYAAPAYPAQAYAAQGYAQQAYAYPQQQAYGYGGGYQPCNTCQAPVYPVPQPTPCPQACQPYIPQPQFQEIRIGDVYSGGVGITDVGGGGGGGGNGNFEVQGFGDISGFVSNRQQTWANATAKANANANSSSSSYANATNNVNIDVSAMFKNTNNYKGGGKMGGYKQPSMPADCNCDTGMTGGVGGGSGHKSGGGMGGWGGKSGGWGGVGGTNSGGSSGCNTCGGGGHSGYGRKR